MSNIQKQHKISPAIAWLTIQKFIIFYCPLDGEHTTDEFLTKWGVCFLKLVIYYFCYIASMPVYSNNFFFSIFCLKYPWSRIRITKKGLQRMVVWYNAVERRMLESRIVV